MKSGQPIVSVDVCIISFDAIDTIEDCIQSVALVPGASIVLREHSRSLLTLKRATQVAARTNIPIRTSHDASNPGFATGMNSLAAASTADWLYFLNPDAAVLQWPFVQKSPPAGSIIGAVQTTSSGQAVRAWGRRYRVRDEIARSWLRRAPRPRRGRGFVGGAGLLIERDLFEQLGGFDPAFFLFYEDIDLCVRATAARASVAVDDGLTIRHDTGTSTRKNWGATLHTSYQSGRHFHAKHGHWVRGYDLYVMVDAAGRCAVDLVRQHSTRSKAYAALATVAARNLVVGSKTR